MQAAAALMPHRPPEPGGTIVVPLQPHPSPRGPGAASKLDKRVPRTSAGRGFK
eukprot:CAMPEP_0170416376 /NCGR_PEP_ID=MMETSP0117_2-20130122/33125_1 /TAXON_ID=400756 /ORGANISM="Durinskia baltica, Strain CSIRO CS-38" /LENGTH=52 /DNA_ID=CAMNT_0010674441 /DNA_START=125 /DNA_END=280 /DNA_ORIENTATION=-